jgi:hypothetical protein
MNDPAAARRNGAFHVPLVGVASAPDIEFTLSQQDSLRGIKRRNQLLRENRVVKSDPICIGGSIRIELGKLRYKRITNLIVRVETKDPISRDLRLLHRIASLICMRIKASVEYAHIGIYFKKIERTVGAAAVDHYDVLRPTKTGQCASNILLLVVSQQNWCDVIQHDSNQGKSRRDLALLFSLQPPQLSPVIFWPSLKFTSCSPIARA